MDRRRMLRRVESELLDELPPSDRRAQGSRRDLQRLNGWMGHAGILARLIRSVPEPPKTIAEIGAGDGTLMLRLARRLSSSWRGVSVQLLDRQSLITPETLAQFE